MIMSPQTGIFVDRKLVMDHCRLGITRNRTPFGFWVRVNAERQTQVTSEFEWRVVEHNTTFGTQNVQINVFPPCN